MSREERLELRRHERAVDRMDRFDRKIFLGHVVDELSYPAIAVKFSIGVAEVEESLCRCLGVLSHTLDQKDPWWWRFWP